MFHLILLMIKSQMNPCRDEEIMMNAPKNREKFLRDSGSFNQSAPASLVEFGAYSAIRPGKQGLGDDVQAK
jgi:hypothetical protein